MKNIISILMIALLFGCNTPPGETDTQQTVTSERAGSGQQKDITSLVYTEAQAVAQFNKTPNVKGTVDTFWYNITPDFKTNGQITHIGKSFGWMMKDINNGLPFKRWYRWEYSTPNLRGQYHYIADRNKHIVAEVQRVMDSLVGAKCIEYGFYVASNEKNITGYYQKFSIKKKITTP